MKKLLTTLVAATLAIGACGGGDPIEGAENCTELGRYWANERIEPGDAPAASDEEFGRAALAERVMEQALLMAGEAAGKGFDMEAQICFVLADEAGSHTIVSNFDNVQENL